MVSGQKAKPTDSTLLKHFQLRTCIYCGRKYWFSMRGDSKYFCPDCRMVLKTVPRKQPEKTPTIDPFFKIFLQDVINQLPLKQKQAIEHFLRYDCFSSEQMRFNFWKAVQILKNKIPAFTPKTGIYIYEESENKSLAQKDREKVKSLTWQAFMEEKWQRAELGDEKYTISQFYASMR